MAGRESVADTAVQFVKVDEASEDELKHLERLNVLIQDKHVPVANLGLLKPGKVVARLQEHVPFMVNMTVHTKAWRCFRVRPASGADRPEQTRSKYCVYDKANGDYLYTAEWVEMLTHELSDPRKYRDVTGYDPVPPIQTRLRSGGRSIACSR